MKEFSYREQRAHGAPDFPVQYYHITGEHPRYEMNLHWHRECELVWVQAGKLELYLNNVPYVLEAGDCALIGGGVLHRACPSNAVYDCVVFDAQMLTRSGPGRLSPYVAPLSEGGVVQPFVGKGDPAAAEIAALCDVMATETSYFELKVYAAIGEILYLFYRAGRIRTDRQNKLPGHRRQTMAVLLDWIEANYAEKITLAALSQIANTNEKYLCRFFRAYTGNSPMEYINRLRVERACLLMTEDHATVTEAAMDSGFNDVSYFCKIFKRYKGVTPKEYRKG